MVYIVPLKITRLYTTTYFQVIYPRGEKPLYANKFARSDSGMDEMSADFT